ncbi:MAG: helix-turn-helix transcriptional regulator [Micromonospora sp.]
MRNTSPAARGTWATYVTTTRERIGMSKAELARRLGVDRGTVHRWEAGTTRPEDAAVVHAFADLFGLDADEALTAAGLRLAGPKTARPAKEPPLDPDVLLIMRRLANPDVSEAEKTIIRATLRHLAQIAEQAERRNGGRAAS